MQFFNLLPKTLLCHKFITITLIILFYLPNIRKAENIEFKIHINFCTKSFQYNFTSFSKLFNIAVFDFVIA